MGEGGGGGGEGRRDYFQEWIDLPLVYGVHACFIHFRSHLLGRMGLASIAGIDFGVCVFGYECLIVKPQI